ncbi:hypothetical protein, partial [Streptomyces phytophilus]|uniref:hypothetical protein n=1 Tax=Streptomyces phytophilus TaxID=722715 RepID=UPI00403EE324
VLLRPDPVGGDPRGAPSLPGQPHSPSSSQDGGPSPKSTKSRDGGPGPGNTAGGDSQGRQGPTRVVKFTPWDEIAGRPADSVEVTDTAAGSCWTRSPLLNRLDAWRCATDDNALSDPCFGNPSDPSATYVLCVADRRTPERLIRMDLTEPLPGASDDFLDELGGNNEYTGALTIELADGQLCAAVSGAGSSVAGKPLTFECEKGDLFGRPDTGPSVWTVPYRADGAAELVPADVVTVRQ